MFNSLLRFFGVVSDTKRLDEFDPIFGPPTRSVEEWLSGNPALKKQYEAELIARSSRSCVARDARRPPPEECRATRITAIIVSASGGFLMLLVYGFNLSVAVWVGFIALFGVWPKTTAW